MQIQCPSCLARTEISDEHAGAKVQCTECGRVSVAVPAGASSRRRRAALLALVGIVSYVRSRESRPSGDGGGSAQQRFATDAAPDAPRAEADR